MVRTMQTPTMNPQDILTYLALLSSYDISLTQQLLSCFLMSCRLSTLSSLSLSFFFSMLSFSLVVVPSGQPVSLKNFLRSLLFSSCSMVIMFLAKRQSRIFCFWTVLKLFKGVQALPKTWLNSRLKLSEIMLTNRVVKLSGYSSSSYRKLGSSLRLNRGAFVRSSIRLTIILIMDKATHKNSGYKRQLIEQEMLKVEELKKAVKEHKLNLYSTPNPQLIEFIPWLELRHIILIHLDSNKLKNIEFLSYIDAPFLKKITVTANEIQSIEPLTICNFPYLKELFMTFNKVQDLGPLQRVRFPKLEYLGLNANMIADISVLRKVNFPQLESLYLSRNNIWDPRPLIYSSFPKLTRLSLFNCKIQHLRDFPKMNFPLLEDLYLQGNCIDNIAEAVRFNFTRLNFLGLHENRGKLYGDAAFCIKSIAKDRVKL